MNTVIAREVTKTFSEGRETVSVLKGASLEIAAGEVVALEGPSGSGKTTFLSILGCLLGATGGHVEIAGEPVDARDGRHLQAIRRRHIGFVFQQFNLFPALSALENVEYALNLKGIQGAPARTQALTLLERVGMQERATFHPRDLSGGQKQRVAIARALVASPALVLADEPTASLDSAVATQVLDLFAELARSEGRSLLIVTHDPRVRRVADRVVTIVEGRIAA
ncbi:MAG TPA: ABC transporter ATP-binding protein [Polyangiaceae bacterium]|jgi:putative ABC transport system ATP-binding protein|nr:ABC transporter ATP-binding protein [Polyangiaceae bacterium]